MARKQKWGQYGTYDEITRSKIAHCVIDNGVAKASRKFTLGMDRNVSETTVGSMSDQYVKIKKTTGIESSMLSKSPRGQPLMLGHVDDQVQNRIRKVRLHGGIINGLVVQTGAEGIMTKMVKHKLEKYGGSVVITRHYTRSLLRRMGFVKRNGTKSVQTQPSDFEEIKSLKFIEKVRNIANLHNIPDSLIIYWDQTGCQLIPGGHWTMEKNGSYQVTIAELDNKCQITLLLAITKSGALLPPQLIYAGKTDKCLPKSISFPECWDVTYTKNH